ncbi:MAG: hypothetical protein CVU05_16290 [Bacteroidetes bacterium HGW-Bacteroidetes-21]|jgi:TonB family protein|nr:MAG: hypothetical protein CVU05_16290 [Bacteroidetes bacterium HGW-Bacteroidetes-21]
MKQSKVDKYGITATILFHGLFLLLILFFGFKVPDPPATDDGILINFGNSETGFGDTSPEGVKETAVTNPTNPDDEILTQNIEESVFIQKETNKTNPKMVDPKIENKETQENKVQQVNQNALFPGNNSSQGEGITEGNGDQGGPDGNPNSNIYNSHGQGVTGNSWSLSGRSNKALPKPKYTGNEQGKVVVEIFVDRAGNVVKANTGYKGTTTSNQMLRQAAFDAAMNAKFDIKPDAPEVQRGVITYIFELQ